VYLPIATSDKSSLELHQTALKMRYLVDILEEGQMKSTNNMGSKGEAVNKSNSKFPETSLQWRSRMEKMQTASDLIGFAEKFRISNTKDDENKMTEEQNNAFWILLCEKLRSSRARDSRANRSLIARVLRLRANEPPPDCLRCLVEMAYDPNDIRSLMLQYPPALHLQSSTDGDLLLHKISRRGYQFKKEFESILLKGIEDHVGGVGGFGGLVTKNKIGQTPLAIIFASIASRTSREYWEWLCDIIKLAVQQTKIFSSDNDADSDTSNIPLLHAAIELGSPAGLINRILLQPNALTICDSLGRTPLLIAVAEKSTSDDLIGNLIRRHPAATLQKDKQGNLPLNLKLRVGRKPRNREAVRHEYNYIIEARRDAKDLNLIGAFVQGSPESLEIQDVVTKLPPFMLASVYNQWPIDVVYGLLRTSPWVISSYSSKD